MAVSVMSRVGPCSFGASSSRRVRASQPSPTARGGPAFLRFVRPQVVMPPNRAFYRNGGCGSYGSGGFNRFNNGGMDEQTAKRMMSEFENMAKQWRETGRVSGGVYWPGGGFTYKAAAADKPDGSSDNNTSTSTSSPPSLPLDVVSTEGFFLLYADVPGLSKSDLSIKLSKERVLTVSGERRAPVEEGWSQKERVFGSFSRSWSLPDDADSEGISAKVTEGVLTITVPKKQLPEPEVDDGEEIAIN